MPTVSAERRWSATPPPVTNIDPATTANVQPVGLTGWTLVLSEEFGGTLTVTDAVNGLVRFREDGPSWATWYPDWPQFAGEVGGNHSNTNQEAYYDTGKVSLSGGALQLACDRQTTFTGLDYTAGCIQSWPFFNLTYGYMEARIKIDSDQAGHWPAWWISASDYNAWPPEIDIWEWFGEGAANSYYLNNSYGDPGGGTFTSSNITGVDQTVFHTYGAQWANGIVRWYRDGSLTNTCSTASQVGTLPQYLILNNGARTSVGPTFTSCGMTVDYVRVWQ